MVSRNSRPCSQLKARNLWQRMLAGVAPHQTQTNSSMKRLTTILAALALGTVFSIAADEKPAAPAGEKPRRNPEEIFKKLDKDNDGKISKEEFKESPMAKRE